MLRVRVEVKDMIHLVTLMYSFLVLGFVLRLGLGLVFSVNIGVRVRVQIKVKCKIHLVTFTHFLLMF